VANSDQYPVEERRLQRRYPIEGEVEYRIVRQGQVASTGIGVVSDLSDTGILFNAGQALCPGWNLELLIPWPTARNPLGRVDVCAVARIVRTEENWCAARILKYDFQFRPCT